MPKTLDALERYLGGGSIKWVGPATAEKIIKKFGDETIYVLEKEPEKLATIRGITKEKAIEISESFVQNKELWKIVDFLEEIGIASSYAKKVYELYGINAIEEIKSDPYRLIDVVKGISFKTIDEAALRIGVNEDDEQRIIYGIKYGLLLASYNGHTCVVKNNLLDFTSGLLQISESTIEIILNQLKVKGTVFIEDREEEEWVYLRQFYEAEIFVAGKLIRLDNVKNRKQIANIKEKLEELEKANGIELSEKQREAIYSVSKNNVCVITGGPGTGKTTIIKSIIDLYKNEGKKVVLCAPTRKSCKEND
ncbi:MAG: AAA family ATPase [Clostridia bacterium]|nr:AAA family ATPase [Clostridia bacterium]MCI9274685.1 AAA family ATPase [Clostridia bacterium]